MRLTVRLVEVLSFLLESARDCRALANVVVWAMQRKRSPVTDTNTPTGHEQDDLGEGDDLGEAIEDAGNEEAAA